MSLSKRLAVLCAASALAAADSAHAQQLGTVFVDFDGEAGTPQGTVSALNASTFPQAMASTFTTAQLQAAVMSVLQADYAGQSVNITDTLPATNFTRLVIGNTGTTRTTFLGFSDEIDFRNKRRAPVGGNVENTVSILASNHNNIGPGAGGTYTLGQAAQYLGETAAHELGHVLGLAHSDVASTFQSFGGGAAGRTAVNKQELMSAITSVANSFNDLTLGAYSKTKLECGKGINVEIENGAASFIGGTAADPTRAGDTTGVVATAAALNFDPENRVTALGSLGTGDTSDVYKFTGKAGQLVTAEVFSNILNIGDQKRIIDPVDTALSLIDSLGNVVPGQTVYPSSFDFDGQAGGDAGTDQLLLYFALPADGTYGVRVAASGADLSGNYELLVLAPEPTSLLALAAAALLRRRRIAV